MTVIVRQLLERVELDINGRVATVSEEEAKELSTELATHFARLNRRLNLAAGATKER